ncbi:MAG: hypothetical protein FWE62_04990, partial [Firmicutes bacterium]|nr:hypothetical protein [Bacillota bacterium]
MTNKERALNILHYCKADRMPAVHFGYWGELLQEWAAAGYIPRELADGYRDGNAADRALDQIIGWDFNWYSVTGPSNGLYPAFEHKVIETLPDGFVRVQNYDGLIERLKPGAGSIPAEDDYQLKDRKSYEALYKPKMQFKPER